MHATKWQRIQEGVAKPIDNFPDIVQCKYDESACQKATEINAFYFPENHSPRLVGKITAAIPGKSQIIH